MATERAVSSFALTAHTAVAEIEEAEWDALAEESVIYLTHRWLRMVERDEKRGREPRYFAVRRAGGELVGALPCYYLESAPSWLYDPAAVFEDAPEAQAVRWFPAVVAGGCAEFRGDVLVAHGVTEAERDETTRLLRAAARDWADARGASLLFMYMPAEVALALDRLGGEESMLVFQDVDQLLRVREATLAEYTEGLRTQGRKMARREIKRYERSGVRTEVTSLRDAPLDELAQLHTNLMRKYGHEHEVASSLASLEEQRRELGDLGCVFLARDGTRALGFSLCFRHAGTLYVKTVGFDYVSSVPLYGNLVFYEPLRVAMREGLRALHFGLSSNQGKLVRGSDALPLYAVLEPFEALDRTRREALERYGERRLERFWMDFGPYVVHQKFSDLLPASRR